MSTDTATVTIGPDVVVATVNVGPESVTVVAGATIGPPGPAGGGGGDHPDLATHNTLGLATDAELTAHDLDTTAVHGIANTANLIIEGDARLTDDRDPTAHAHVDGDLPAGLARDTEVTDAIEAHRVDTTVVHGIADTSALVLTGDARLSDVRTPTDSSVTDAKVAAGAAIAETKLALASDAAAGTASRRTLGTSATSATAGNDARLADDRTPTAHVLNGASHTASGLTGGHVLRASGATAFDFAAITDADLPSTITRDSELDAVALPRYRTGLYYSSVGPSGTAGPTLNRLTATSFEVPRSLTVDRIGIHQAVAAGAGGTCRLLIYSDVAGSGGAYPGAVLLDAGTVDTTSTGAKEITISQALTPGLVWLAALPQVAVANMLMLTAFRSPGAGSETAAFVTFNAIGYRQNSVTGAAPNPMSTTVVSENTAPLVYVRIA